jgi:hypothetical protein
MERVAKAWTVPIEECLDLMEQSWARYKCNSQPVWGNGFFISVSASKPGHVVDKQNAFVYIEAMSSLKKITEGRHPASGRTGA